jgi:hypothetical protein
MHYLYFHENNNAKNRVGTIILLMIKDTIYYYFETPDDRKPKYV